jgi:hypothetical protein
MPQIYVIYRPEDARKKSKEIIAVLEKTYGASNIQHPDYEGYVDVYAIEQDIQKTDFLLVIIGNYWADMVDESGVNLLKSVYDPVHMAIATAINSGKRMIPILVDGASMPHRARLPRELRKLTNQEPVEIDKNVNLAKSLNKGLKDIIKRDNRLNIPGFVAQVKLPQRQRTSTPTRQPSPQRNRQYWVKRAVLPIVALAIIAIVAVLMIMPIDVESTIVQPSNPVTAMPTRPTPVPTSIPSRIPPTTIPSRPKISAKNASQLTLIEDNTVSRAPIELVIFSQDQTLFIFVSPEQQAVQVKEIATNNILKTISTAPHDPIAIQLNTDETRLLILSSNGRVASWSIPTE